MKGDVHDDKGCCGCCVCYDTTVEQPPVWETTASDGVFIKMLKLTKMGMIVPQHAHKYAHTTLLATGRLRMWKNDELVGDLDAPLAIEIEANVKHKFQSLLPDTVAFCIHAATPIVTAEHQLRVN